MVNLKAVPLLQCGETRIFQSITTAVSNETGDEIPDDPHGYYEFLEERFCSKAGRARICGRRVFVEVARSQRRN